MGGLSTFIAWIGENEAVLSGGAALVVMLGFVASPLGAGLRSLMRRAKPSSEFGALKPVTDIGSQPVAETDRPSVAVLPFASATDDKDSEMFADGMTDDVITALGQVPGFFITSGNSTFAYKGQSIDTRQIGRELGVRYVVEGRVRRAGQDVRINATLVEARTGEQIWSERFSGDLSDVFALQDEVARSIVGQLQPELTQAESRRGARLPTEDLDAWTLLHSARMRFRVGHGRDALAEAIRLGDAALEKDPDYAEAHAFLIEAISHRVATRWSNDPERDNQRCVDHCRKALELDPENPNVLYGAAIQNHFTGHPEVAVGQIERCCAINPNDAFAQGVRGVILGLAGRGEEGLDAVDLALRLSPHDPRTYYLLMLKGWDYVSLARYSEAEQTIRRSLDLYDGFFWTWFYYPPVLAMQGRGEDAKMAITELKKLAPDLEFEDWEKTYKTMWGYPSGERGALIDRQVDSLRDIWPS